MKKKNKVDKGSHYNKKGAWAIVRKAKQARASGQFTVRNIIIYTPWQIWSFKMEFTTSKASPSSSTLSK